MCNLNLYRNKDGGFILVITMLILVVLTLIGISAIRTTNVELQIAGNEKWSQEAFYKADGGSETGTLLLEDNLSCPSGFSTTGSLNSNDPATFNSAGAIEFADSRFAYDELMINLPGAPANLSDIPSNTARSIRIPLDINAPSDSDPHTNLAIIGRTELLPGNAIEMAAGYEGKGKGAGASGAIIAYNVYSQDIGFQNSETNLRLQWKHLIGQEGNCR